MKHSLLPLVAAMILSPGGAALAAPPAVSIYGASVVPPDNWQPDANQIMARFAGNQNAAGELAEVSTVPDIKAADDATFFVEAEAWKSADLARFTMKSVHFNDTRFKGTACVKYDGLFEDPAAAVDASQIRLAGYICRHPQSPGLAIDITFSRRAAVNAMPDATVDRSNAFFDSLTFVVPQPGQQG